MNESPIENQTGDEGARQELLADLADDFAARHRRGERPSVEEYAQKYPAVAKEIRELFPAMRLMEQQSGVDPTLASTPVAERVGATIGRYKLLERIGEGGFGVVFMAEQQHPIRRKVALKVIKAGMDTSQVIGRFEAERQALTMMDHPNIAKVLDAGATDAGRPYFVMDLVPGVPITEYCEKNQLPPRERLGLFVQVCQAVQHAHTKGIIHRDLKPSNVLVMVRDDKPLPKVIDFGVAKAASQQLTDRTLFTQFAQMVGTPLYMSPEQAQLGGIDVDTRSDVYSLGVLLYELLTGTTPFDRRRLGKAALEEVRRIIREEEPPRPSTRLGTAAAAVPSATPAREQELRRLSGLVRGELDWIVMKCLEKDRTRRYGTAAALAQDVERHLVDEPVEASPPTLLYRVRKFARRHRVAFRFAASFVLLLMCTTAFSAWQASRAISALREANRSAREEREAKLREAGQRRSAEAVARALESVFSDLDPYAQEPTAADLRLKLVGRLNEAAREIDKEHIADPTVRARLRTALAVTLRGLGNVDQPLALLGAALRDWETAAGPDSPEAIDATEQLGLAYNAAGRPSDAANLLERVRDWRAQKLGPRERGSLAAATNLADAYKASGRAAGAIRLYDAALKQELEQLGANDVLTVTTMNNLGVALIADGRFEDAIPLLEKVRARNAEVLGPDHPNTLIQMHNLARANESLGRLDEAIELVQQVHEGRARRIGPSNPQTIATGAWLDRLRAAKAARQAGATGTIVGPDPAGSKRPGVGR